MNFSIVHLTNRQDACHQWFADALCRQCKGDFPEVIFVDAVLWHDGYRRKEVADAVAGRFPYKHVNVKPNVWQGPTRLTKVDFFAASNARNTGVCYASQPYIFFQDDLSVMLPGWIDNARHAAQGGYVALGSYRKVRNLVVEDGEVKSWEPLLNAEGKDTGLDCRWGFGSDAGIVKAAPNHLYGCSFGLPTERMLQVNGQDEIFDGMGYEDVSLSLALTNVGCEIFYNRNMATWESDEKHFQGTPLRRDDPGKSPMDASHSLYYGTKQYPAPSGFQFGGVTNNPSYTRAIGNRFDLRSLRNRILAGGTFPVPSEPKHRWYDNVPLEQLV